jgi:hypothetical protein
MKVIDFKSAVFCALILLGSSSGAAALEKCYTTKLRSWPQFEYCLKDLGANSGPKDIIYFWHGVGGGANNIFSVIHPQSDMYDVVISRGIDKAPLFVGMSFGSQAIVPLEISAANSVSLKELTEELFPEIEKRFGYDLSRQPLARHMMGLSLGGFNALNTVAMEPGKFSSLVALCRALLTFNPFSRDEFKAYLERHKGIIKRTKAEYMIYMLKEKFKNYPTWMGRNPLEHLKNGKYQNIPVYLSTGLQDEYGFMEGAAAFAQSASGKVGDGSIFAPIDGDHCFFDAEALKRFLSGQLQSWQE